MYLEAKLLDAPSIAQSHRLCNIVAQVMLLSLLSSLDIQRLVDHMIVEEHVGGNSLGCQGNDTPAFIVVL